VCVPVCAAVCVITWGKNNRLVCRINIYVYIVEYIYIYIYTHTHICIYMYIHKYILENMYQ